MRRPVTALLLVLSVPVGANLSGHEVETMTVCEVVQKGDSLNGKVVAIRGELYSDDHGHYLLPVEKCRSDGRRRNFVWPDRVHLVFAPYGERDHEAYEAQEKQIREAFGGEPRNLFRVIITFVGPLKTKWGEVFPTPAGSYVGVGFGFGLASPVELSMFTSTDIEVRRLDKKDDPTAK